MANKLVLELALVYKNCLKQHGRTWKFEKSSDVSKTYAYRTLSSFIARCKNVHGLEPDGMKEVVRAVVTYSHKNRLTNVGIAILNRYDVIDICCDDVSKHLNAVKELTSRLTIMNQWVDGQTNNRLEYFKSRVHRRGFTNLISCCSSYKIDEAFICLSKSAIKTVLSLDEIERNSIKPIGELLKLRTKLLSNLGAEVIKNIFGTDSNVI